MYLKNQTFCLQNIIANVEFGHFAHIHPPKHKGLNIIMIGYEIAGKINLSI